MKKIMAAMALALLLAGCAGTQIYSKPGATKADLDRDAYECKRDAEGTHMGPLGKLSLYKECMRSKGWTEVD